MGLKSLRRLGEVHLASIRTRAGGYRKAGRTLARPCGKIDLDPAGLVCTSAGRWKQLMTPSLQPSEQQPPSCRVLVVEDEFLIRMLLEDMLSDLGHAVAAAAGSVGEATELAKTSDFDLAILDVNLDGRDVYPVADILVSRGVPFIFVTGYGGRGLPEAYRERPTLQKPFQLEDLRKTLARVIATNENSRT
jgi:CheY-like chemotaxis protein